MGFYYWWYWLIYRHVPLRMCAIHHCVMVALGNTYILIMASEKTVTAVTCKNRIYHHANQQLAINFVFLIKKNL
nr:MAG TPA: hypothetical protein [Caudoviricetes sp.]